MINPTITNAPAQPTGEVLPCGNCGAPARFVELAWRVKCTRPACGVEGGKFERRTDALAAWNTRPALTKPAQDVGALVEAATALLDQWQAFRASDGNHECAYRTLAKGQWAKWDALATALNPEAPHD